MIFGWPRFGIKPRVFLFYFYLTFNVLPLSYSGSPYSKCIEMSYIWFWRHNIQHNDTHHNGPNCDTQHNNSQSKDAIILSVIRLSVTFSYCYAECHYAECRYSEGRGALDSYEQSSVDIAKTIIIMTIRISTLCSRIHSMKTLSI